MNITPSSAERRVTDATFSASFDVPSSPAHHASGIFPVSSSAGSIPSRPVGFLVVGGIGSSASPVFTTRHLLPSVPASGGDCIVPSGETIVVGAHRYTRRRCSGGGGWPGSALEQFETSASDHSPPRGQGSGTYHPVPVPHHQPEHPDRALPVGLLT